jgi:hypothetical protein
MVWVVRGIGASLCSDRLRWVSDGGDAVSVLLEHGERGQDAAVIWSVRGLPQDVPSDKLSSEEV